MRQTLFFLIITILTFVPASASAQNAGQVDLPRFPAINPDGTELVFSWGGDLWLSPVDGGQARRLTRHDQDDLHASWSPDGRWLVFTSMRDGYMNLWQIHRDGTRLSQLTHSDRFIRHPHVALNEDGEPVISFSSMMEADVYRSERPYFITPQGGEPRRIHEAFGSEPRLSPDGRYTVFTRGGYYHGWNRRHYRGPEAMDLWLHDRDNSDFTRLTERDGNDGGARWLDANRLIFMSDRDHRTVNLYQLHLHAEDEADRIVPLTDFNGRDIQHFDVSRDGSTAVMQVWDQLMTLDLIDPDASPQPVPLRAGEDGRRDYELRSVNRDVSEAALSPDGRTMATIAYGRVFIRHMDDHSPTRLVTPDSHARHQDLTWSPDGLLLYFTSDEDGSESIYRARVALTRDEIRRNYRAASEGDTPVVTPRPKRDPHSGPQAEADEPAQGGEEQSDTDPGASVGGYSPDDPFAPPEPTMPRFEPQLITPPELPRQTEPEPEAIVEESPLVEQDPELPYSLDPSRWHDAVRFSVQPVIQTGHNDRQLSPSPDGNMLAFRRGRGDLMILDLISGETRTLSPGWDDTLHWRWSPDSQHIAFARNDMNFSSNVFIVPADGSREPVNITRHPRNDVNPRWSADSRKLTFLSNRSSETYHLYRVYLDPSFQSKNRRDLISYYQQSRQAAQKRVPLPVTALGVAAATPETPPRLQLNDAWRRIERVSSTPVRHTGHELTPGGDQYVFNSPGEGLMVMNWQGQERKRLGPEAPISQLNLSGEQVVFVRQGRAGAQRLTGGSPRFPDINHRLRINLGMQSVQKFREAARLIGEHFYQPDMKGLDWPALVADYETLIARSRTASEFSDIANRLMGELDASHMGVSNPGPGNEQREPSGRLGILYRPTTLEDGQAALRVTGVVPGSPADLGGMRLQEGDLISAIDLLPLQHQDSLLQRLRGRVGEEVIVSFQRPAGQGYRPIDALFTPIDYNALAQLRYDAFRETSRQQVRELSDGRLGYIHIQSMNQSSLEEFQGDLYASAYGKDGLIIDVRNNGGGSTTDRILTSIMTREHAYTVPAGADPERTGYYPQDRLDAPRYTLPINMLANEKSYSNAEILAHAFTTLDRGTLIGEQTYGGVISTGRHTLIDGASVRRPFRGWYLPDGTDMDQHGAMPDLRIIQTPEDETQRQDRQLKAAVADMLKRLDGDG
ncbi:MAG: peptidase S41 [Halomonadaceae bacterium]|nr:MAG: peptidase S41 [Halomonadaceae bacterium]